MPVCEVWEFDPACCDLPDDTEQELIDRWQAVSSEILWRASGMRYGTCEIVARPCLRRCDGGYGWPGVFMPYKDTDGGWHNIASCACVGMCDCVALSEVVLVGPVAEIVQVLIDGDELMPENYRLDTVNGEYRLLRTDGGMWPSCADPTLGCDELGSFCVSYRQGIELDDLAIAANSELTCQLVRACLNLPCILPKNVQALTRRGVAITFDTAKGWIRSLPMVGAFLDAVNPEGLSSPSTVWSPDLPETRVTVVADGS